MAMELPGILLIKIMVLVVSDNLSTEYLIVEIPSALMETVSV